MSEALNELAAYLEERRGDDIQSSEVRFGELTLVTTPAMLALPPQLKTLWRYTKRRISGLRRPSSTPQTSG